jgi:hypothetical protein
MGQRLLFVFIVVSETFLTIDTRGRDLEVDIVGAVGQGHLVA